MSKIDISSIFNESWLELRDELAIIESTELWLIKSQKKFSVELKHKLYHAYRNSLPCTIKTKNINYDGKIIYLDDGCIFYLVKFEYI